MKEKLEKAADFLGEWITYFVMAFMGELATLAYLDITIFNDPGLPGVITIDGSPLLLTMLLITFVYTAISRIVNYLEMKLESRKKPATSQPG
jgi:hypothetical protein